MPETTSGKETTDQVVSVSSQTPRLHVTNGKWESPKRSSRTQKPSSTWKANETNTGIPWPVEFSVLGEPMSDGSTKQRPRFNDSGKGKRRLWSTLGNGTTDTRCLLEGRKGDDLVYWE